LYDEDIWTHRRKEGEVEVEVRLKDHITYKLIASEIDK